MNETMINKLHFDTCIDVKIHREVFLSRGVILSAQSASGPSSFQGPLGKELQGDLTMREPVRFARIKNDSFPRLPDEVVADLSHDQEYLYDMSLSVIEGSIEDDLECREPGAVCHSFHRHSVLCTIVVLDQNPSS